MEIEDSIEPDLLSNKTDCIDNLSEIILSKKHYGVIQSLLRTREGEIIIRDREKDGEDENIIGNAGYLKL